MAFGATPTDGSGTLPLSCVYVPGIGLVALEGAINSTDGLGNQSASVVLGHKATTILNLASAARATYSSGVLPVGQYQELALDLTVTAFTGGTSPTVTFKLTRKGADGVLYMIYLPAAISAAGVFSTSIGSGFATNASFGANVQLDMIVTGAPTSVTFSGSLIGK